MKVGLAINLAGSPDETDAQVFESYAWLIRNAESLGYSSAFFLEHHFSDYSLSPCPLTLMAYAAGSTQRLVIGTSVIVLPWHNPVRVAESISILSHLAPNRCIFGFGRGKSEREFQGLDIPLEESSARFDEALKIVRGLLNEDSYSFSGNHFCVKDLSIRPRPQRAKDEQFYVAVSSKESAVRVRDMGLGIMCAPHLSIAELAQLANTPDSTVSGPGSGPIVLASAWMYETPEQVQASAWMSFAREFERLDKHYQFSKGSLEETPGYKHLRGSGNFYRDLAKPGQVENRSREVMSNQVVGTGEECISCIDRLWSATRFEHLLLEFGFGGTKSSAVVENVRLFSEYVLPRLELYGSSEQGVPL